MHDEEIRIGGRGHLYYRFAPIDRYGNPRDSSSVLQLQAVEGIRVVLEFANAEQIIQIVDEVFESHHANITHPMKARPDSSHLPLVCDSVAFPA